MILDVSPSRLTGFNMYNGKIGRRKDGERESRSVGEPERLEARIGRREDWEEEGWRAGEPECRGAGEGG